MQTLPYKLNFYKAELYLKFTSQPNLLKNHLKITQ